MTAEAAHRAPTGAALAEGVRSRDRRAVARLITLLESADASGREIIRDLYALTGRASTVGVTGAPGSGKSTLVDGLIACVRASGASVAVVAVDPTSPFSRGAFLGDRTRMASHAQDDGVYIRSMASRGHLGGLSIAVPEALRVLDAAGYDVVIVETVGVGQSEVEVAGQTDTTVVVVAPGMGDSIQAFKAGILEVADVFCVNKCDRPGADEAGRDLAELSKLGALRDPGWRPPVVRTTATTGEGIDGLWDAVLSHRAYLGASGMLDRRRRERVESEIRDIAVERLRARVDRPDVVARLSAEVLARRLDPWTAAEELAGG